MLAGKQYPFVQAYLDRHGTMRTYLRRKGQQRIRLVADPGSALFEKEYAAALKKQVRQLPGRARATRPVDRNELNSGVYFLRAGDRIKIGVSTDVRARIAAHQVSQSETLYLMLVVPGGSQLERELHHRFQQHHLRGEWFRISDEIADFVRLQRLAARNGKGTFPSTRTAERSTPPADLPDEDAR